MGFRGVPLLARATPVGYSRTARDGLGIGAVLQFARQLAQGAAVAVGLLLAGAARAGLGGWRLGLTAHCAAPAWRFSSMSRILFSWSLTAA